MSLLRVTTSCKLNNNGMNLQTRKCSITSHAFHARRHKSSATEMLQVKTLRRTPGRSTLQKPLLPWIIWTKNRGTTTWANLRSSSFAKTKSKWKKTCSSTSPMTPNTNNTWDKSRRGSISAILWSTSLALKCNDQTFLQLRRRICRMLGQGRCRTRKSTLMSSCVQRLKWWNKTTLYKDKCKSLVRRIMATRSNPSSTSHSLKSQTLSSKDMLTTTCSCLKHVKSTRKCSGKSGRGGEYTKNSSSRITFSMIVQWRSTILRRGKIFQIRPLIRT